MKKLALLTCILSLNFTISFEGKAVAENFLQAAFDKSETKLEDLEKQVEKAEKAEKERKAAQSGRKFNNKSEVKRLDLSAPDATPYYLSAEKKEALKKETNILPEGPGHSQVKQIDPEPKIQVGGESVAEATNSGHAILDKLHAQADPDFKTSHGTLHDDFSVRGGGVTRKITDSHDGSLAVGIHGKGIILKSKNCWLGGCPSNDNNASDDSAIH